MVGEWGIKHGGMRNNSAGIRVTRTRGRKQSKRSRGYSDLSAVTSGNGSVDKLRGTTISRPCLKGSAKREVTTTFLSRISRNPIRNRGTVDRENNYNARLCLDYLELPSFHLLYRLYQSSIFGSRLKKEMPRKEQHEQLKIKKTLDGYNFEDSNFRSLG